MMCDRDEFYETFDEKDMLIFGRSLADKMLDLCVLLHCVEIGAIRVEDAKRDYEAKGGRDFDKYLCQFRCKLEQTIKRFGVDV